MHILGATSYSHMAADPSKRQKFIESTIKLINKHNFDGMDLDWEYPGWYRRAHSFDLARTGLA